MSASYLEKMVPIAGSEQPIRMQLWDTAGSERFKAINRIYYRDAVAALIVYDITKKDSMLVEAEHWIKDIKDNAPPNIIIALAGNKADLYKKQEVSMNDLDTFANKHSITIKFETSAKTDKNINEVFQKIVQRIDETKDDIRKHKLNKGGGLRLGGDED